MSNKSSKLQAKSDGKSISITHEEENLPSPEVLEKYHTIDPKFAETIVEYMQKEQNHRHDIDTKTNKRRYKLAKGDFYINIVALILAFIVVLALIVLSAFLLSLEEKITIWPGLVSVILAFISLTRIVSRKKQ